MEECFQQAAKIHRDADVSYIQESLCCRNVESSSEEENLLEDMREEHLLDEDLESHASTLLPPLSEEELMEILPGAKYNWFDILCAKYGYESDDTHLAITLKPLAVS